jgi:D-serine deaminase-like pyridoxal phosphate-dependent protein
MCLWKLIAETIVAALSLVQKKRFEIPRRISNASNLNFAGLLTHAGHSYGAKSKEEILEIARYERDSMKQTRTGIE